jgi:hypothetical protein
MSETDKTERCGHTVTANGFVFICDLPKSHPTRLHEQRLQLRDHVSITNWGDDGLAPHATTDRRAQHA